MELKTHKLSKVATVGMPLILLSLALFACNIQSYVLDRDSAECKQECNSDFSTRRSMCTGKYSDEAELEICNDDAYDRYMRCLTTCE